MYDYNTYSPTVIVSTKPLFIDEQGQPYSRNKLYRIWTKTAKKAGISISLYCGTRHSRASQKKLEMEKQIAEARRQELGHDRSSTTMEHYHGCVSHRNMQGISQAFYI